MSYIHISDEGTIFKVTMMEGAAFVDLSEATTMKIGFEKPGKGQLIKTATLSTDGKDGKMQIIFDVDEISEEGTWKWQAYAEWSSGKWHTNIGSFTVKGNLVEF